MSFDWIEYLKVARELAGEENSSNSSEDAKLRASISRAYYAAFNQARWQLRHKDFDVNIPQDGRAHEYVQTRFSEDPDEKRKKIAEYLNRLRIERTKADYRDIFGNLPFIAKKSLTIAASVFALLKEL